MLEEGKKGKRIDLQNSRRMMGRNVGKVVVTLRTGAKLRYTVKKVIGFPIPSRDVTNQTLPVGE
jgi:hypothetical protein